jgi:hypothetical protein
MMPTINWNFVALLLLSFELGILGIVIGLPGVVCALVARLYRLPRVAGISDAVGWAALACSAASAVAFLVLEGMRTYTYRQFSLPSWSVAGTILGPGALAALLGLVSRHLGKWAKRPAVRPSGWRGQVVPVRAVRSHER